MLFRSEGDLGAARDAARDLLNTAENLDDASRERLARGLDDLAEAYDAQADRKSVV